MKIRTANSFGSLLIVLLMMITCAKEKDEEGYVDEEQDYGKAMYDLSQEELQAYALADWRKFTKQASTLMLISEQNLKTLNKMAVDAEGENLSTLMTRYNQSLAEYNAMAKAFKKQDESFQQESKDLQEKDIRKNVLFKEKFLNDLTAFNVRLEKILEEN